MVTIPLGRPRRRGEGLAALGVLVGGRFSRRDGLPLPVTVKSKSLGSLVMSPTLWKCAISSTLERNALPSELHKTHTNITSIFTTSLKTQPNITSIFTINTTTQHKLMSHQYSQQMSQHTLMSHQHSKQTSQHTLMSHQYSQPSQHTNITPTFITCTRSIHIKHTQMCLMCK